MGRKLDFYVRHERAAGALLLRRLVRQLVDLVHGGSGAGVRVAAGRRRRRWLVVGAPPRAGVEDLVVAGLAEEGAVGGLA